MACRGSQEPRGSKLFLMAFYSRLFLSRLARASWIEMQIYWCWCSCLYRRGSQEPRGSKCKRAPHCVFYLCRGSQEPRGSKCKFPEFCLVDFPVEARKSLVDRNMSDQEIDAAIKGRGSQEPRGSKSCRLQGADFYLRSRLARASWIEICQN